MVFQLYNKVLEDSNIVLMRTVQLVEQEMDEENKLALQAIKYLGGVGFFTKHAAAS